MKQAVTRISMAVTAAGPRLTQLAQAVALRTSAWVETIEVDPAQIELAVDAVWQAMTQEMRYQAMAFTACPVDWSINQFFQRDEDVVVLVDDVVIHTTLADAFRDQIGFTDEVRWALDKRINDPISFNEVVTVTIVFLRDVFDTITLSDSLATDFDMGELAESMTLADDIAKHIDKRPPMEYIALSDALRIGTGLNMGDTVPLVEHGLLLNQGYFDHTGPPDGYFESDYFGDKRTW